MATVDVTIPQGGLTTGQAFAKRLFDIVVAAVGLFVTFPVLPVAYVAAALSTGQGGLFRQTRIGRHGWPFRMLKFRSMRSVDGIDTAVTTDSDARITRVGRFLRKTKIDELPQLWNVLVGDMSLVGPRPDVPGFADCLEGDQRLILSVRPGITGPASLAFRDEERLLAAQADPESYNRTVVYPAKVRINLAYVRDYSFRRDLLYLWQTVTGTGDAFDPKAANET